MVIGSGGGSEEEGLTLSGSAVECPSPVHARSSSSSFAFPTTSPKVVT